MSIATLVLGQSGCGKSTSIRNLNPEETFIIRLIDKPLPFRGGKVYKELGHSPFISDPRGIVVALRDINQNKPNIKNIIVDDFQHLMALLYMDRAKEKGYDKFIEMAQIAWFVINSVSEFREDLLVFFMSHTQPDEHGVYKCKTIGKMLDEKLTIEGLFTIVLHAVTSNGVYSFLTQHDGIHPAKSPMGMLESTNIDNDLNLVREAIISYKL